MKRLLLVLACLLLCSQSWAQEPNAFSRWESNGISISDWVDLLDGTNFVQTVAASQPVLVTTNGMLDFDGIDDYMTNRHGSFSAQYTNGFGVSIWSVNRNTSQNDSHMLSMLRTSAPDAFRGWVVRFIEESGARRLMFTVISDLGGGGSRWNDHDFDVLTDGDLHQFGLSYNVTGTTMDARSGLVIDGEVQDQLRIGVGGSDPITPSEKIPLSIGGSPGGANFWRGRLSDAVLWTQTISIVDLGLVFSNGMHAVIGAPPAPPPSPPKPPQVIGFST